MSELGSQVRRLREAKGWSQAQLAVYAGMGPSAVSQIETGKRNPSAGSLSRLATALGTEVADLFPKAQSTLPLEELPKTSAGGGLTLEEMRPFLEERAGSSWIALPDEEWKNWWRFVSRNEAKQRIRQIRAEAALLAEEFMATYGKADRGPELVPRGRHWGDVYSKIFARKLGAEFYAPGRTEAERDFKKRAFRGLARAEFYETPQEITEQALRTSAEAG